MGANWVVPLCLGITSFTWVFKGSILIPCNAKWIYSAPVVHYKSAFYIFGGYTSKNGNNENRIARLDSNNFTWSLVGELNQGRSGHNIIEIQDQILVVGGAYKFKTERCNFVEGKIHCTEQEPKLEYYTLFPELFAVPKDYCNSS